MNVFVTLIVLVVVFALLFRVVVWLIPAGPPQTVANVVLALFAIVVLLNMIGLLGPPVLIHVR